jgi:hypothetical protein
MSVWPTLYTIPNGIETRFQTANSVAGYNLIAHLAMCFPAKKRHISGFWGPMPLFFSSFA